MSTASAGPSPASPGVPVRNALPAGLTKLLWELRDAYEESTGEAVGASRLLLDRSAFVDFLSRASRCSDERVRNGIAKIQALAPDLLPAGIPEVARAEAARSPVSTDVATASPAAAAPRVPSQAEIDAEHRALIERVRAAETPAPSSSASLPSPHPPAGGASAPPAPSYFDRARAIAGFLAAILVSLAAARYLLADSPSTGTLPPSASAAREHGASAAAAPVATAAAAPLAATPAAVAAAAPARTAEVSDPVAALFAARAVTAMRIHGSNTVGEKLTPNLVEAFLKSRGAALAASKPGAGADEKEVRARIPGQSDVVSVEVFAHGSATAFADLGAGSATIGQSSRRIKPEERDALLEKDGDLTLAGAEHVLALDGVAVIVNPSSGLGSLTLPQLAGIFAGDVHDWSELGGRPGPIHLVARDEKSGTWDTFKALVLAPSKKELNAAALRLESSGELVKAVAADPAAIGFVGLPYVKDNVKALALAADEGGLALLPTPFTVGTEDYPLSRRLYLYTPTAHDDAWSREFVEFALSDAGQRVVADTGFVSQTPRPEKVRGEPFQPAAYRSLTAEAERLSLNFRFESGRDGLDTKAVRDLDRLVRWLDSNPSRQIVLLGFTDASGDARRNSALSLQRARSVERELVARGIRPAQVLGLGQVLPVASNASEDGRNRNRRVEVWVR